ncbi:hypothetical protein RI367_000410 [Sorochytrium milnesiophthora]
MASAVVKADAPAFQRSLEGLLDTLQKFNEQCTTLSDRQFDTSQGLSFLEVKNHSLMSYLISLLHLMHTKLSGEPIEQAPSLSALLELRVVLEKIRPVETKLKYRIDKMVRAADQSSTAGATVDPLNFKPNPAAMVRDDMGGDDSGGDNDAARDGVYRPPKLAPVHYDEDASSRASKRVARPSNRLLRDLASEYDDAPEHAPSIGVDLDLSATASIDRHFSEKQDYEESHFVRLNTTRREKKMRKQQARRMGNEMTELVDDFAQDGGNELYEYLEDKRKRKRRP